MTFTDWIAIYAAFVSTATAIEQLIRWRTRHSVKLSCRPNMVIVSSNTISQKHINFSVINRGETSIKITQVLGCVWDTHCSRLRDRFSKEKRGKYFIFNIDPNKINKVINPGETWEYIAPQTEELEEWASKRCLYLGISHSMSDQHILKHIKIRKK
jgi:hypothetical protein